MIPSHASLPLHEIHIITLQSAVSPESDLEAWQRWFQESRNSEFWSNVACIECELGRSCLKTPRCAGAEADDE